MSQDLANIFDQLRAYKQSRALAVALTLGLLDTLEQGAESSEQVASSCGTLEAWTGSLLAVLADLGLVAHSGNTWRLTPKGRAAATDDALRCFAEYHLHCYEAWLDLPHRCRGSVHDGGFHRRALEDPEFVRTYLLSMESIAQWNLPFLEKECCLRGAVLDVGAGPSTFCRHMACKGNTRVTALDLPPLVEAAKRHFDYPGNFEWIGADFRDYTPEKKFDGLFCSHLLEYASASDLPEWLARLHGFLRPGGTAAFVVFLRDPRPKTDVDLDLFELSTGVNGERLGHVCTTEEFLEVLREAVATEIACEVLPEGPSYSEYLVTCTWA